MIKKSILYIILKRILAEAYGSHRSSHFADNLVIFNKTPSKRRIKTTANLLKLEKNDRAKVAITYPLLSKNITRKFHKQQNNAGTILEKLVSYNSGNTECF